MTLQEFKAAGEEIGNQLPADVGVRNYFHQHASRLHQSCRRFNLFDARLGDVLEIGPFFGLTPFLLRARSSSYTILEGPDPVVRVLEPLYARRDIALSYVDFFDAFGPTRSAPHRLGLADSRFDTILCWETMEHFNFNPVKFVRELHRVLKPGGRVCITVPNKASFQSLVALLTGRGEKKLIEGFFQFEDYEVDGKKAFYGFHWREYSPSELSQLFARAGFQVQSCGSFTAFQDWGAASFGRRGLRVLSKLGTRLVPRCGTHVYLEASK